MNVIQKRFFHFVIGLGLCLPSAGYSDVPFANAPLFIDGSAKPNIVFAVDDSGSMDSEVASVYAGLGGRLFNSGAYSTTNVGGWNSFGGYQRPFAEYVFFLRSSDYNSLYYNPDITYSPWSDSTTYTFGDADPTAALYEPTSANSPSLDLTQTTTDTSGNSFYPATYFKRLENNSETFKYTPTDTTYGCGEWNEAYSNWVSDSSKFVFNGDADGFGPDNACIDKVEISALTTEMQNFANWFSYYRRVHHATRAAISESLEGLSGIRVGTFWINNRRTLAMQDLDTERGDFLDDTYEEFGGDYGSSSSGTPLRTALKHAGDQFNTNKNVIQAECQKNFTLLFTDGFNNAAVSGSIGNADGDNGSPYADKESGTLADVAMTYYEERLRQDLDAGGVRLGEACYKKPGDPGYTSLEQTLVEITDPSYDETADCNANLHMNTYTVGFGNEGEKFVGNGYDSVQDVYDSPPDWTSLSAMSDDTWGNEQIDDLLHAAVNGRGEFYNASNVEELRRSVSAAIRNIIQTTGSATNVTFNTATLEQGSEVYTASFNSGDWSGSVAARALNPVTGGIEGVQWDAANTLNNQTPTDRFIVTNNNGGVLFNWSNLSSAQQDDLNGPNNDSLGPDRLSFIRGVRTGEGSTFRTRTTVLGDVVNSSPVFVGRPASAWPDRDPFGENTTTGRYSTFKQAQTSRTPVVYAGANDGMLHGFNAETGQEVMAYIPSFSYSTETDSGLNYLSDPEYQHRFYVDLSPAVSDVYIGGAGGTGAAWKTVLIGGMRSGGRGLFALDVTDPASFDGSATEATNLVLWEFSHPDLGAIIEPPLISLVEWGNNDYRWSALVPNGYNSDNGKTGLFVLDIEAGQDGWDTTDYRFIELDATGQGLSPIRAVDYKDNNDARVRDGIVDRVYGGDLDGQMWVVDLSTGSANSWGSALTSGSGANAVDEPLFTAFDSSGIAQPITTAPGVGRNVYNTNGTDPNLLVFFGTGRYLTDSDPLSTQTQSFYGIWDQGAPVTRGSLASRTITEGVAPNGTETRTVGGDSIDWTDTSANAVQGWYVDFNTETGERVIRSPLIRGAFVGFNTVTPSQDLCQSGGTSWVNALRFDGTTPDIPVFDVNNDGKVNSDDSIIAGVRQGTMVLNANILGDNLYQQGSDGSIDQSKVALGGNAPIGRSGWREIYQE